MGNVLDHIFKLISDFNCAFSYPVHEEIVESIARKLGFKNISLSSRIMPMMRIVPRGYTASSDAYLTPHIQKYLEV